MGEMRCSNGLTTSPTSSGREFVRVYLCRIAASSFLMSRDNSATIPRGGSFSSSQCVLELWKIDDARTALRMPDGRAGPDSETLNVGLSRLPAVAVDI